MATITWNSATGGDWGVAANWSPAQIPTSADDVIIPSLSGSQSITIASGSRAARTIQAGGDEKLRITGGTLTVSAAAAVLAGTGSVEVAGGTLALTGNGWSNASTLVLSSGTLNLGGTFTQPNLGLLQRSGGTVNLNGTMDGNLSLNSMTGSWLMLSGGTIRNGTVTVDPSVSLTVASTSTFENVTVPVSTDVLVQSTLNLVSGLTLNGRLLLGGTTTSGTLNSNVLGQNSITGTGQIVFNGQGNRIDSSASSGTLVIDSGIALSGTRLQLGGAGAIDFRGTLTGNSSTSTLITVSAGALVNKGTLSSSAGTLGIFPTTFSNDTTGQIITTGGELRFGDGATSKTWNNAGVIQASNTSVFFGGTFSQANIGNFQRSTTQAGTVRLNGFLNGNLSLNSTTGPWLLNGGTIRNGTVTVDPSVSLTVSSTSTFENVTVPVSTDVLVQSTLNLVNGLTLNGRLLLGGATTNGLIQSNFSQAGAGLQTITGTGQIVFNGQTNGINSSFDSAATSGTLVIDSGVTLSGTRLQFAGGGTIDFRGTLTGDNSSSTSIRFDPKNFINRGLISSSLGTLSFGTSINTTMSFENNSVGQVITTGGTLQIGGTGTHLSWNNAGIIQATNTSVFLGGSFTQVGLGNFQRSSTQPGTVTLYGTLNGNLNLNTTTGSWLMAGGTIRNGTVTVDPSVSLTVSSNSTFENVTVPVSTDVLVQSTLNLVNGLTLNGRLLLGGATASGTLNSNVIGQNSVTGTGQIVFNGQGNTIDSTASSGTLVINSGIALSGTRLQLGGAGTIDFRGTLTGDNSSSTSIRFDPKNFINRGLISSSLGTLSFGTSINTTMSFENNSVGQVITTGGTLQIGGTGTHLSWNNAGIIQATNTSVFLGGSFTQVGLGNFQRSSTQSGTVTLYGTLNGNLNLNTTTGSWLMAGGTIRNGTVTVDPSISLTVSSNSTFENVTVSASTDVLVQSALNLVSGLTLNGRLMLGGTTTSGTLVSSFTQAGAGQQTIAGSGQIVFSDQLTNSIQSTFASAATSATLIIGTDVTLTGKKLNFSGDKFILQGQLIASGSGASVTTTANSFSNLGTIRAENGGTVTQRADKLTNVIDLQSRGTNLFGVTVTGGKFIADNGTIRLLHSSNSAIRYLIEKLNTDWTISGVNAKIHGSTSGTENALLSLQEIGLSGSLTVSNSAILQPTSQVTLQGSLTVGANSTFGSSTQTAIRQTGGFLTANGTVNSLNTYQLDGGTLSGSGALPINLDQNGGVLAPGNSPGCLAVGGNYDLALAGSLQVEIAGATACTEYDRLTVNGSVTLDGTLDVQLSYMPTVGSKFLVLQNDLADAVSGKLRSGGTILRERQVFLVGTDQLMRISYLGGDGNDVELEYLGRGYLVSNNAPSGPGSLAQAVSEASNDDFDSIIAFAIEDALRHSGGYLIESLAGLVIPVNDNNRMTRIDATTQYDYVGAPIVELRRNALAPPSIGLDIGGSSWNIVGLSLTQWTTAIVVAADNISIAGNYIGIPLDGTSVIPNETGIQIGAGTTGTKIGIQNPSGAILPNVISGSSGPGIEVFGASSTAIQGNYIGTDPTGLIARPNQVGVRIRRSIVSTADGNLIGIGNGSLGSSSPAAKNLISGNTQAGVEIDGGFAGIQNNLVIGNWIGVDVTGLSALPNANGVVLINSTNDTTIARNVISGNSTSGIVIADGANGNVIQRNIVGLDALANQAVPNANTGIEIKNGSFSNEIGGLDASLHRNHISGNGLFGIHVSNSDGNSILGNVLGLNGTGSLGSGELLRANGLVAIQIDNSDFTTIGKEHPDGSYAPNLIAGLNGTSTGIAITQSSNTYVVASSFGLSVSGLPIGYFGNAISLSDSDNSFIGDSGPGRNFIGQYASQGVVASNGSDGNSIRGNYVGVRPDGQGALFTEQHSTHGIALLNSNNNDVVDNLIGGNHVGVFIAATQGSQSVGNSLDGNRIGLNSDGNATIPNHVGVLLGSGAQNTSIVSLNRPNIVSGNGIGIEVSSARDTLIDGNWIGTDGSGSATLSTALGNSEIGINHVGGVRTQIRQNVIVASGPFGPLPPSPPGAVEVLAGDAILYENRIFNNYLSSIRTDAFPGAVTITQARLDGFAVGQINGATPYTTLTVEFFEAATQHQAERYVGRNFVVTDENGHAEFEIGGLGDLTPGKFLTATITGAVTEGDSDYNTSRIATGAIPQVALIRGLPTRSLEGTPFNLQAFAVDSTISGYAITGYVWEVLKGSNLYAIGNEAGIQFAPDDEGTYTVRLKLTLTNTIGNQQTVVLGPHDIQVVNVAPTPQFEIEPYQAQIGQLVSLRSSSTDPGRDDVLQHSWEVRYSSPSGPIVYSAGPSASITTTSFTPAAGGNYYVKLTVDDLDGGANGSRSLTRLLQVLGAPSSTSILVPSVGSEGQTIRASAPESELQRSDVLTFTWQVVKNGVAYPFISPSTGVIEFVPNDNATYVVSLTISDGTNSIIAPPQNVVVTNASPIVSVQGFSGIAEVGQPVNLTADIFDPGSADTHQVDWVVEHSGTVVATGNSASSPWPFAFTPTSAGVYKFTATATDDDFNASTGVGRSTGQRVIYVADLNQSLAIQNPSQPVGGFIEGTAYSFVALLPALPLGVTVASYQWSGRDRLGRQVQLVSGNGPSVPNYAFTPPSGGEFLAVLELVYSNGQTARAISQPIEVQGLAPQINSIDLVSHASNQQVYEGEVVRVRTSALDTGERVGLSYLWELQRPGGSWTEVEGVASRPSEMTFTPLNDGVHKVRVTVSDSEGLSVTQEFSRLSTLGLNVLNALPLVQLNVDINTISDITFSAQATDPGALDQPGLQYSWSVNGGVFSTPISSNNFTTSLSGLSSLSVRVTDDTGFSEVKSYVLAGTSTNDSASITNSDANNAIAAGAQQLIYLGLDGDDTITVTAGISMPVVVFGGEGHDNLNAAAASESVVLDGGSGNDTLTGGFGNDRLIAGSGTNILIGGNGNNTFIGGGSDTMTGGTGNDYYYVHFSDVVLNDTAGGNNTVDLSGATQGISLDFGSTSGTAQTVFPGSTLALNGTFQTLVGSPHNDELSTNKPGTTLQGGLGNDTLVASALNVTLDGGAGDNELVLSGASGNFVGGQGNSTILGTLAANTNSTLELQGLSGSIDVVGTSPSGAESLAAVNIVGGSGNSTITAQRVRGKIYAYQGTVAGAISEFGSTRVNATRSITVSQSSDIDIFGSTRPGNTIVVSNSQDIDIFGSGGDAATLTSVTRGTINGSLFGSVAGANTLSATVTASSDIDIFGSARAQTTLASAINNSTDIDIFGSARSNSQIVVSAGQDIDIFGVAEGSIAFQANALAVPSIGGTIHISEFGSVATKSLPITVTASQNIDIFGSASSTGTPLNTTIHTSSDIDIFGTAARQVSIVATASQDIDIFGVLDGNIRLGPASSSSTTDAVTRAVIEASGFGSATVGTQLNLTVHNSSDIDIFGGVSSTSAKLSATIVNSSDIDIFGSVRGGNIQVTTSQDIDIFGQGSDVVSLSDVDKGTIFTQVFGSATTLAPVQVTIANQSSDIDIFGSPNRNARIEVTSSSNIDIFGGTAETNISGVVRVGDVVVLNTVNQARVASGVFGTTTSPSKQVLNLTVHSSSDIDIFGSTRGTSRIEVTQSQDIDIFGAYGDQLQLQNAQRVRIEGGVFGTATTGVKGLTAAVVGNSQDIDIFGTSTDDIVTIEGGLNYRLALRNGLDELSISNSQNLAAVFDQGDDGVTVNSGSNMLLYLADGDDRASVHGGENIRAIGGEGADQFQLSGGSFVDIDGGAGNDEVVMVGGSSPIIRLDGGQNKFRMFGGVGSLVVGGPGIDQMSLYGRIGNTLSNGQAYAVLDGGAGDDQLSTLPLFSLDDPQRGQFADPLANLPPWMTLPALITEPDSSNFSSSVALIGGTGNDKLQLYGNQRLFAFGGDGDDELTLLSGSTSTLSGGDGQDQIFVKSSGVNNYVFAGGGNDTVQVTHGSKVAVFTESGDDSVVFATDSDGSQSLQSFARGGEGDDTFNIFGGSQVMVAGEVGQNTITVSGGQEIVAAGGNGSDSLTVSGGDDVLLLGESGHDQLTYTAGTQVILSGGDGNDQLTGNATDVQLYGDDGDDNYKLSNSGAMGDVLVRELIFLDGQNFESEARGSDTIDLSSLTLGSASGAVLDLRSLDTFQTVVPGKLRLQLKGAIENIIGTSGNDVLQGNIEGNRLEGGAGNDQLFGFGGDDVLVGGAGQNTLVGGDDNDQYHFESISSSHLIIEADSAGVDRLDFSQLAVGIGNISMSSNLLQSLAGGLVSVTLRNSTAPDASTAEIEELTGTRFNDAVIGNGLDNRFELLGGNDSVNGSGGSDLFVFAGSGLGLLTISDSSSATGRRTLDFAAFDAPLNLDLSVNAQQNLSNQLLLTLVNPLAFHNVVGTSYDDHILGNANDNALFGAAGADTLEGREGADRIYGDLAQVVLLDFDSAYRADRGDYNYTLAQRQQILQLIASRYAAFNWQFTLSESEAKQWTSDSGRAYVRLNFSEGRGGGVSGDAGEIDFRNINRGLASQVNINSLKSTLPAILTELLGHSPSQAELDDAIVKLTAHIAAHELGHTAGLRHADALGPIGSGFFGGMDLSQVYPVYTGPLDASETPSHLIASPASMGTTIADALAATYWGARESIKLAFNEQGRTIAESSPSFGSHSSLNSTAQNLGLLANLHVPNLALSTGSVYSNSVFQVSAIAVVGKLASQTSGSTTTTERDVYRFSGRAGEWVNLELMANGLSPRRGHVFDGQVKLYNSSGQLIGWNDDEFEGTKDAVLFDVQLPSDGEYYLEVSLSDAPSIDAPGDRYELFLSRFKALPTGTPLPSVLGDTIVGGLGADQLFGSAADDLFLATENGGVDTIFGKAGFDTLDVQGLDYQFNSGLLDSIELIANENVAPSATLTGVPTAPVQVSTAWSVSLQSPFDPSSSDTSAGFRYAFALKRASDGVIVQGGLTNAWASAASTNQFTFNVSVAGQYTLVARILDVRGGFRDYEANVEIINLAPTDILIDNASIIENRPVGTVVGVLSASDPDAGDTHSFSLITGTGDADNSLFEIVGNQLRTKQSFDFEARASYSVRVQARDSANNTLAKPLIITVRNAPEMIGNVVIGDGTVQRSLVKQISLLFDTQLQSSPLNQGAFKVERRDYNSSGVLTPVEVPIQVSQVAEAGGRFRVVISFVYVAGSETVRQGSLALQDGNYQLLIDGSKILSSSDGVAFDANGDSTPGGSSIFGDSASHGFYSFFGDIRGLRVAGAFENNSLRKTLNRSLGHPDFDARFDADGNDAVGAFDNNEMRKSLLKRTFNWR